MLFEKYKIKLKENSSSVDHNLPRFSLSYRAKKSDPRHVSYNILTALSENSDIIIELNTDFFDSNPNVNGQYFQQFADEVLSLGLTYSRKEFPSARCYSILGFRIESKNKKNAQKIAVYVPRDIWTNESFRNHLPICGARYYITNRPMDAEDIVNKIWTMDGKEIKNTFKLIIFDYTFYGQMGIETNLYNIDDFNKLLGYKKDGQ
ncbi:MAG: hypothetical protein GX211_06110 [Clostridiaceae bacterium]|jgi:hypothetical protein|nr:hypothetical protein [Clostridiaceae bacterium]